MRKTFAIFFVVSVLTLFMAQTAMSVDTKNKELDVLYAAYIDDHVSRCETKAARIDSGSENIRKEAALRTLMGSFFKANKTDLIKEMIADDVGTQKHQVDYYLTSRFYQVLREVK